MGTGAPKRPILHAHHMELGLGGVRSCVTSSMRRLAAGDSGKKTDDQARSDGLDRYLPAFGPAVMHDGLKSI